MFMSHSSVQDYPAAMWWMIPVLMLLAAVPSPVRAQTEQDEVLRAREAGAILPFSRIRDIVSRQVSGQLISNELDETRARSGVFIYRLTYLQPGGRVVRVDVDARSGRILSVEGQ
jgi:uncharacterized membrane protein YkoI